MSGAMFNPIAVTLPPALKTGNLEIRTDSVVAHVRMNAREPRAGRHLHRALHEEVGRRRCEVRYPRRLDAREHAPAAAFGERRPREFERHARAVHDGPGRRRRRQRHPAEAERRTEPAGRRQDRPASRFRTLQNIDAKTARKDFIRGYVMNATGGQTEYPQFAAQLPGYGSEWKKEIKSRYVAQARVWIAGGEMLARKENFVELDPEVKDHWGIPVLKIHFTHCDNDRKLIADFQEKAEELFRKAGGEIDARPGRRTGRLSRRPRLAGRAPPRRDRRQPRDRAARQTAPWRLDPRSRHRAHERQPEGRRTQFLLPDARHPESVCLRRQRLSLDRRQASDARR